MEYEIIGEPRAEAYGALIRQLARTADSASLVMRDQLTFGRPAQDLLTDLLSYGGSTREVSSWPGTELHATTGGALQINFPLNPLTAGLLADATDGLFEWQSPRLPEDLAIYDANGDVVLETIAHEGWAMVRLTEQQRDKLEASCPELELELIEQRQRAAL